MAGKSDADTAIPSWENSADKPMSIDGKGELSLRLCSWVPEARPGSAAAYSRELPSGSVRQSECIMEFCVSRVSRARCASRRSAFVSRGTLLLLLFNTTLLLLFNTTRAHTPDPQAQEPLSQWTEVWPTQPARAVQHDALARARSTCSGTVVCLSSPLIITTRNL